MLLFCAILQRFVKSLWTLKGFFCTDPVKWGLSVLNCFCFWPNFTFCRCSWANEGGLPSTWGWSPVHPCACCCPLPCSPSRPLPSGPSWSLSAPWGLLPGRSLPTPSGPLPPGWRPLPNPWQCHALPFRASAGCPAATVPGAWGWDAHATASGLWAASCL